MKATLNAAARKLKKITLLPELNIALFSFLLNFAWEVLQTPFFVDITDDIDMIVWYRFHCTVGDMTISLVCYWLVSLIFRNRYWFLSPTKGKMVLFIAAGVIYTIFSEIKNVSWNQLWGYSELMPKLPFLNVGIVPLLQWIFLPAVLVFLVKRQLS